MVDSTSRCPLMDLPKELQFEIIQYLVPSWDDGLEDPIAGPRVSISQLELARTSLYDPTTSLQDLTRLNRTCSSLHRLSLPLLWRHVTWMRDTVDESDIRHHVDGLIETIWMFGNDDTNPPQKRLSFCLPGGRFSQVHGVSFTSEYARVSRPMARPALLSVANIVQSAQHAEPLRWTCLRPRAFGREDIVRVWQRSDAFALPHWLGAGGTSEWEFSAEAPYADGKLPSPVKDALLAGRCTQCMAHWYGMGGDDFIEMGKGLIAEIQDILQHRAPAHHLRKLNLTLSLLDGEDAAARRTFPSDMASGLTDALIGLLKQMRETGYSTVSFRILARDETELFVYPKEVPLWEWTCGNSDSDESESES